MQEYAARTARLHRGSPLDQQPSTRAGRAPAPHGVAAATGDNRPRVQSERRDEVAAREALPPLSDRLDAARSPQNLPVNTGPASQLSTHHSPSSLFLLFYRAHV